MLRRRSVSFAECFDYQMIECYTDFFENHEDEENCSAIAI